MEQTAASPPQGRDRQLTRAVLLAAGLLVAGLLLRELVTLVVAVLITIIIAIPPAALATRLERWRVPRVVGALLGFVIGIGVVALLVALVIPPFVDQTRQFIDDLPGISDRVVDDIASVTGSKPTRVGHELQSFLEGYIEEPERLVGPVASLGLSLLAALVGLLFVLITSFYIAVRPQPLVGGALRLLPPERRDWGRYVLSRLRRAWIGWLQGVGVDMLVTGVLLYVGLSVVDLEFALLFAVFSALLVVVPYFGAVLGGIPPVLFALADSPGKALVVLGIYVLVQQIEGNLIVPLVMAERVRLHPAVIAVGVIVVAQLLGIVGLFIAVPLISTAVILTEELWVKPRERRRARETGVEAGAGEGPPAPGESEPPRVALPGPGGNGRDDARDAIRQGERG